MADTFNFYGKLFMPQSKGNFQPYSEKQSPKGWQVRNLRFLCNTDAGNQFLNLNGNKLPDESNFLYFNTNNNERIKIPFKDRKFPENINRVPRHQKFIVDLETNQERRNKLRNAIRKINQGEDISHEEMTDLGVESISEIENAYRDSMKLYKEFLSAWDFIDYVRKMLESGKYKNSTFKVSGRISASHFNDKDYISYEPNSIILANNGTEDPATARVTVFFDSDGLEWNEDTKQFDLNSFIEYYDSTSKKRQYAPYPIVISLAEDTDENLLKRKKKYFEELFGVKSSTEVYKLGIVVDLVNGSVKKTITYDDLDESTKQMIDFNLITLDEIRQNQSSQFRGETVQASFFKKVQPNFLHGSQEASVSADQLGYVLDIDYDDEELPF